MIHHIVHEVSHVFGQLGLLTVALSLMSKTSQSGVTFKGEPELIALNSNEETTIYSTFALTRSFIFNTLSR